jgi:hypothetical protein
MIVLGLSATVFAAFTLAAVTLRLRIDFGQRTAERRIF